MGSATGKDKATVAADMAISSTLLETSIDGAKGLIINITASSDVSLDDIDVASTIIKDKVSEDANIIWGAVIDDKLDDAMNVTVIATGFNADGQVAKKKLEEESVIVENDDRKSKSSKDKTDDDDDTFYDIMSIFNK
jgi:cell division protein FtsZ